MLQASIIGASGYVGAEIARYLQRHPYINIAELMVSADSNDKNKRLSDHDLHPTLKGLVDIPLKGMTEYLTLGHKMDVVFLATDHAISHDIVPFLLNQRCVIFDLSGAYRLSKPELYSQYYGFKHHFPALLTKAVYGLAEWNDDAIKKATLVAVPGCYPTAAQLALKPLIERKLLSQQTAPAIYAISGVSGVGRKTNLANNFCEVSLQAYSLFTHRHQPEMSLHLGQEVLFMPHLGNFKRGIYQTITCKVNKGVTEKDIVETYLSCYRNKPLVRFYEQGLPALKGILGTPYCDIGFMLNGRQLVLIATVDNLLKGAAAQAVQCMNIRFGFDDTLSLL